VGQRPKELIHPVILAPDDPENRLPYSLYCALFWMSVGAKMRAASGFFGRRGTLWRGTAMKNCRRWSMVSLTNLRSSATVLAEFQR